MDRTTSMRGRRSVGILYLISSIPPGSWVGRIPEIKASLAAGDARWGLTNSIGTLGELVGFLVIVFLIGRLSTRRIAVLAAIVVIITSPLLAFAPTLIALAAALFAWMVSSKVLGATMGALALVEQRRAGRVLMTRYDAVYSVGMLVGGTLAWGCIRAGIPAQLQFAGTNLILLAALITSIRQLADEETAPADGQNLSQRLRLRLQPTLLLLAGISLLASVIDSAVSQWGALFLTAVAGGAASWGAVGYPAIMTTKIMILVRLDRLVRRIGWSRTLYFSAVLGIAAILAATLTSAPAVALIGLAAVGAATAVLGPLVNTGAAEQPRLSAGESRTVLEAGEIPAYLAMPVIIGLLSTNIGIAAAIRLVIIIAILGCAVIGRLARADRFPH